MNRALGFLPHEKSAEFMQLHAFRPQGERIRDFRQSAINNLRRLPSRQARHAFHDGGREIIARQRSTVLPFYPSRLVATQDCRRGLDLGAHSRNSQSRFYEETL